MNQEIQDLQNRIKSLEDIVLSLKGLELNKIIVKDRLYVQNHGIKLTSKSNPTGCYIVTGNAQNTTQVGAEYPDAPNGSIYLSSSMSGLNFFIKYMGAWNFINIP